MQRILYNKSGTNASIFLFFVKYSKYLRNKFVGCRIGYERSKNIKKSQGQILFAPWLFFMFLLRDSRSAFRKCLSIFGTSARSLSDIPQNYCINTLYILQKNEKTLAFVSDLLYSIRCTIVVQWHFYAIF